jgi:glycogen debranching enzyme
VSRLIVPKEASLTIPVKPAKLSRTKVTYLCGASVKTHFDEWKDDPKTHGGIPSELVEIPTPEIRVGKDNDGEYSEIVVPDEFNPGSIMLFATDMDVSHPFLLHGIDVG